ncbi:MAG: tetratricopeptide repeat protein [candidate division KSB1 bacterium]|nr:tetratricopeptide repeat protein [candidate division KSB1 bacterium]MDZ7273119.1 tetratricopeptide repeat protein [candidate division KSB1 bacterium]MDZ7285221.1 tetratricopeptide repeat protein [candidate division KSB1 bacterium]MDZ7298253.1 tetratricopeptide repeat protein [candidate division KSB1 bacterium]MDZ7308272.1 tetratricopeptide repeat protein [candidate division KSB1 bacterium]
MRKSDKRFAKAERLWENGEFEKAMAVYQTILTDDHIPIMARAIVCEYLGRLYIGVGELATAEKYLAAAVAMNPEGVEHHVQLANCLCLAGRQEEAWQMIQKLYQRFPDHPAAIHYMGKMLDERGEHERGFALMKKAIKLDPTNERFLADLSFAYMMHGNAGAAMVCSEEALALKPDDEVVQFIHQVAHEFEKQEYAKRGRTPSAARQQTARLRRPKRKASHLE